METNQNIDNKHKEIPLRSWLYVTTGIILCALVITSATGKTLVGSFFAYIFGFAFGMFYPFVLAFLFAFGIRLIIAKKAFPLKGYSLVWVGAILTLVSALSFASYPIYTIKDGGVDFTSLNSVYFDRMSSFARSPAQIDSFESMSGLGGGYLGLFFITLLGSVWGYIGDAIFFSLLLIVGLALLTSHPIHQIISFVRKARERKVKYNSPYQTGKNRANRHLERHFVKEEPQPQAEANVPKKQTYVPSKNVTAPLDGGWSDGTQGSFYSSDGSAYNPESEENVSDSQPIDSEFHQAKPKPDISRPPYQEEESAFRPAEAVPSFDEVKTEDEPQKMNSPLPESPAEVQKDESLPEPEKPVAAEKPAEEENGFFKPTDSYATETSTAANTDVENSSDSSFTFSIPPSEEKKPVMPTPVENPLEKVAAAPLKANKPAEYKVVEPIQEKKEPTPPLPEPEVAKEEPKLFTEEELEQQKEQEYFAKKQQRQAEALLAKKRAKEERISSLMKYVSDVARVYSYSLPSDSLLEEFDDSAKMEKNSQSAQEKASVINRVFDEFGVKAKATSFTIGASVTRFNIETEHGEKADKIANLTSEFQRALNGDMSVRVETVVEGRSTSGIEVGNIAPMAVSFKDMFASIEQDTKNLLLLPIGKDISGNIVTFPLNKMPHMLVAGTTGSGKSVLIHSMIMTLIMRTYPSQCKLMLIDPKQVEFVRYQDCSHLFCPVISKPESAILALKKLCDEMDRRFTVLSKCRVANLEDYNDMKRGREAQFEDMPYIVCVIDEFADLMQTGGNEVTKYVTRIAQKARACGIHLIIATQRPSKDNVPMIIKANVPCRIGLSCSSQIDSRVILDENGAETLLGRGDLLFKCPGKKSLIRAQSPFISNKDIDTVLAYVKEKAGDPNYDPEFLDLDVEKQEEPTETEGDLYSDIRDFVIHTGITSKSSIMRSFQVSSMKCDQFLARLQAESIITLGPGGKYVLGPAAHLEDFES